MQHLLFIFTDKLMIFFRNFGIFLITYFGVHLVYNLEHFGIFYCAKPGNPERQWLVGYWFCWDLEGSELI